LRCFGINDYLITHDHLKKRDYFHPALEQKSFFYCPIRVIKRTGTIWTLLPQEDFKTHNYQYVVISTDLSEESYLKNLAEDIKWGESADIQQVSLDVLAGYGEKAIPYLQEILTISSRENIRQSCITAIERIQDGVRFDEKNELNIIPSTKANPPEASDMDTSRIAPESQGGKGKKNSMRKKQSRKAKPRRN